jgi:hypothetical protein
MATAVCVWQKGSSACPSGFSHVTTIYGSISDQRGCAACTCNVSAGHCTPTVEAFGDNACGSSPLGSFQLDGTCFGVGTAIMGAMMTNAGTPTQAVCGTASGGAPTGAAVGANPTTVCCTN